MSKSKESKPNSLRNKAERAKLYAGTSAMGYSALGASVWSEPGVLPKAAALGLALKGAKDYNEAFRSEPINPNGVHARARARFYEFMDVWSANKGDSLKDRLKRRTGSEMQSFKDDNFKMRFNRMMGGLAFAGAGITFLETATSTSERVAGATMLAGGIIENQYNNYKGLVRDEALKNEQLPDMQTQEIVLDSTQ